MWIIWSNERLSNVKKSNCGITNFLWEWKENKKREQQHSTEFFFQRDCPSGKLTKEKFLEIYQQFYKKGRVTKFCEQAFQIFDKDRSGHMGKWWWWQGERIVSRWFPLDFVEFLLAVNLTSSKVAEQKIDLFFSMYDMDKNGRIDQHEMHCFLQVGLILSSIVNRFEIFSSGNLRINGYWCKWSVTSR